MQGKRIRSLLLSIAIVFAALPFSPAHAAAYTTDAAGAAMMEVNSMRLLYAKNEHASMEMASTTKIMTAVVALENGDLDAQVKVDDKAIGTEGSSIYLNRGETMSLLDLLYGLMLRSGNDAAVAIAIHVAGSVEAFADLMNQKAAALGCNDTNFANSNGLHAEGHHTSAYDLCKISAYALQNETFRTIVGTTYYTTSSGDTQRTWKNKNKILWEYDGGCGVKTGYTTAVGKCLVFSAMRDGTFLVGVVLNCPSMWEDAKSMLSYGFTLCATEILIPPDQQVAVLYTPNSVKKWLEVYTKDGILYPMKSDGTDELSFSVSMPLAANGPLTGGQTVGTLRAYCNGDLAGETELIVKEDVPMADYSYYIERVLSRFFLTA